MTEEPEATTPRPTGEAAWKAELDATERRNAATKRRAHEHQSATDIATIQRERRLAVAESEQLRVLNQRMGVRAGAGRSGTAPKQ